MNEQSQHCHPYLNYPWYIIMARWVVLSTIFILGIYMLFQLKSVVAWFYVVYSVFSLSLVLPLARCVWCHYHGRWCNTGWGKVAGYLFKKGDQEKYVSKYPFAILLYPLWCLPLLVGMVLLAGQRNIKSLILLLAYILLLFIEKVVLRFMGCSHCHQRDYCPALPFEKPT